MSEDAKKERLFKRLKNIGNKQNGLINGNNKQDAWSKSSLSSIFDSLSSKSKDEEGDEEENE